MEKIEVANRMKLPLINSKYTNILCLIFINFFIIISSIFVFGGTDNFSVDSYGILFAFINDKDSGIYKNISDLRFMSAFLNWILTKVLHCSLLPDSTLPILFFGILSSVPLSIISFIIFDKLRNHCGNLKNFLIIDISLLLVVINVSVGSMLSFPECILQWGIGFLFSLSSDVILAEKRDICSCIVSCLLITASAGFTQQFYSVFAVIMLIVCIVDFSESHENIPNALKSIFLRPTLVFATAGILYAFISLSLIKITGIEINERANFFTFQQIISNVCLIIRKQNKFWLWYNQFSTWILGIMGLISALVWLVSWINCIRVNASKAIVVGVTSFVAYVCMFIPGILSGNYGTRTMMAVFGIYPLFWIGSIILCEEPKIKKITSLIGVAITCCVLLLNIAKISELESNQKKTNAIDKLWAQSIVYKINQYEEKTGNIVSKIAFSNDNSPINQYYTNSYSDCNAMHCEWATKFIVNLNILNHEYLTEIEMPQEYQEYFLNQNWDTFIPDEQIILDEDCIYVCTY